MRHGSRTSTCLIMLGMLCGPPAVVTVFVLLDNWLSDGLPEGWVCVLYPLGIGSGLVCLARRRMPFEVLMALSTLYVLVATVGMTIYGLFFESFFTCAYP